MGIWLLGRLLGCSILAVGIWQKAVGSWQNTVDSRKIGKRQLAMVLQALNSSINPINPINLINLINLINSINSINLQTYQPTNLPTYQIVGSRQKAI